MWWISSIHRQGTVKECRVARAGCELIDVPFDTVENRTDFILKVLGL